MSSKPRRTRSERRPAAPSTAKQQSTAKGGVFHFVNVNPSSETQKSENRSVIRSHASKYIWRQHRAVRADSNSSQNPANTEMVSPVSQAHLDSKEETLVLSPVHTRRRDHRGHATRISGSTSTSNDEDASPEDSSHDGEASMVSPGSTETAMTSLSGTAVGIGGNKVVDGPFNQLTNWLTNPSHFPSMLEESAVSKLMRYAAFHLWPGLIPGAANQKWDWKSAADNWLPAAKTNPALFTAFMYGAASHMQTRRRLESDIPLPQTREEKLEQIICETETIKLLNKSMLDPTQICTDEVILAVLCMAFNRIDFSAWKVHDPFPKPPLRNLQWIEVYGGLSLNDHHISGLFALIQIKGGLSTLKLPGLAETISSSGIMLATKYLTKPRLPFLPIFKGTLTGNTPGFPTSDYLVTMNIAGEEYNQGTEVFTRAGLPDELVAVLKSIRDYNLVVHLHSEGLLPDLEYAVIADRRNWIQFNLVSLPPLRDYEEEFIRRHKPYEACRLAAIIYNIMVLFPLPAGNRPFNRLAPMVKLALINSGFPESWQGSYEMLIWAVVLGGIAARNSHERAWFCTALSDMARVVQISTWGELKTILSAVIWMDFVCDMPAEELWIEASLILHSLTG
ncbi:hypothetical protein AJ80_05379 [Polytolypa hystricis UAMH7299]|uniref:Transcription factor domain-containing protein n=1 Tax=Polytolypa hystricis (strain UAMH7299) TaxID=1447883 RepID=A0A2B7Y4R7_POLH7|nr:hypothetical protein AJ80_05379 [Polytolypa hystricis UAMH7299]